MLSSCLRGVASLLSPGKGAADAPSAAAMAEPAPGAPAADDARATHGPPPDGLECMVTFDDIDETNYVEYQSAPSGTWRPARLSEAVVRRLLDTQFDEYTEQLKNSDCAATTRRLLAQGPPVWLREKSGEAMPMPEGDTHVCALWYASDGLERPAKVTGAVEGEAREALAAANATLYGAGLSDDPADDERAAAPADAE